MKRIRMIVLLFIIGAASLPITALHAAPSVAPPTLITHNSSQPYMTVDSTPTLIFKAASGYYIEILKNEQIIGSGLGRDDQLVAITITTPLSDGLHFLMYRSVNPETSTSSSLQPITLIVESNSFDISDIAPMASSVPSSTLRTLLDRVKPLHQLVQVVSDDYSWFRLIADDSHNPILTAGVRDEYGFPITDLDSTHFDLTINNLSSTSQLPQPSQIADGIYEFRLGEVSPEYGSANLAVNGVYLESQQYVDPLSIISILPLTYHVAVNESFTLPTTVQARLGGGGTQTVNVSWHSSVVDTSQSGTFEFTGTVEGYTPLVELTLVVTNISDYRIILTWDENPQDLDSHLFGSIPEGSFHLYYSNKNYTVADATYAEMERDVTNGYGPETTIIYIKDTLDLGTYRFGVHKFSGSSELSLSNATVSLYKGNELLGTFTVPNGTSEMYWRVFQIVGGELMYGHEHHLDQLTSDMDDNFETRINQAISAIHRLSEHPSEADVLNVMAEVNSIKSDYSSITNIESYIVNYDNLASYLYLVTE